MQKKIKTALITVYHKDDIVPLIRSLDSLGVRILSTGGTYDFIKGLSVNTEKLESLTGYPSILSGRVKSLHPKIFGGILAMREDDSHKEELEKYEIPEIDLVVVDLYPFEETVKSADNEASIIEKIDIGGIALIRAAAKNYKDVLVVSHRSQYNLLYGLLEEHNGFIGEQTRREFAKKAFAISSGYDAAIFNWFDGNEFSELRFSTSHKKKLRYGENPHQKAYFFGNIGECFEKLHGKEISYNNLLDIDAAINLINEFDSTCIAIIKHNNACGVALDNNLSKAWQSALTADPVSAFGGVIVTNAVINTDTANLINKIFFEVIIAPDYTQEAYEILSGKVNRIILKTQNIKLSKMSVRTNMNGFLVQEKDSKSDYSDSLKYVTQKKPDDAEMNDLLFANKIVKHTKSNAIVLVKNLQMLGSGIGQTSRVDALKQAIEKAKSFNFSLKGAVLASDAFFPFKDSVEIAAKEGITAIIQPGGSIRDKESVDFCNQNNLAMVFTGIRHFKH